MMLQRLLNYIFGIQPSNEGNNDSFEQNKKEFYSNFPKNPVTLPNNEGSERSSQDESPSCIQENAKINKTDFHNQVATKNQNEASNENKGGQNNRNINLLPQFRQSYFAGRHQ